MFKFAITLTDTIKTTAETIKELKSKLYQRELDIQLLKETNQRLHQALEKAAKDIKQEKELIDLFIQSFKAARIVYHNPTNDGYYCVDCNQDVELGHTAGCIFRKTLLKAKSMGCETSFEKK